MSKTRSSTRRYVIAGAAMLVISAGAFYAAGHFPPLGPSAGTIAPGTPRIDALGTAQIPQRGRYVLVDAAAARLFMIEDGRVRDSMKVIVGKPASATPSLRSTIFYATFNPYWNVPTDLAKTLIAPKVLKEGTVYLTDRHYEVVDHFGAAAKILPPESVDWAKVASGEEEVHVRQLPGVGNSMGQVKFNLAYVEQIYLHDTPKKELFAQEQRNLSNGCVRLEDAPRFARWLLKDAPGPVAAEPEQHVPLPRGVPITIAYLDDQSKMQLASLY